jgi:hypothetical protein
VTDVFDASTVTETAGGATGRMPLEVLAGELFERACLEGVSLVGPGGCNSGSSRNGTRSRDGADWDRPAGARGAA